MWKLQALLYSFLIPKEFSLSLGALSLSSYRVILIVLAPWVLFKLFSTRRFRWSLTDAVALLVCSWPILALLINTSFVTSLESGGILFLETFVPFFLARLVVRDYLDLRKVSKTLLILASVMALLAIPEAITGRPFVHQFSSLLTGNLFEHAAEIRFGIWRSYGPADHPIILGTICALAIPLGFALIRRGTKYASMTALSFAGVVASASSGPILSIVVQASLYSWAKVTRGRPAKWWALIAFIFCLYISVDLLSNRDPFRVMFSYLLFNEHNGYVRYNMWLNSFFLVSQNLQAFFFGYGFSTEMMSLLDNMFWTRLMSVSVDSYWLVILLRYGTTMLLLNVLLLFLVLRGNIRRYRRHKDSSQRVLIQAWLIATLSLSLVACTVHFWGSTVSLFFIVMAISDFSVASPIKKTSLASLSDEASPRSAH